jgi:hypothetical protein
MTGIERSSATTGVYPYHNRIPVMISARICAVCTSGYFVAGDRRRFRRDSIDRP